MTVLASELIETADRYIDENHARFAELGLILFKVFGSDNKRISTQVRSLQQVACTATRFADIEDYVKNQMGKETDGPWKWREVGSCILAELKRLRAKSTKLDADTYTQMAFRLYLARGWARAVVSDYLFQVACRQMDACSVDC